MGLDNVSNMTDCYGCGVCASVCPKKIISIRVNKRGFYVPRLDAEKCIHCGLCLDVCAYTHERIAMDSSVMKSWAAWSNDNVVRRKCSSGGIAFEIGRQLINKGYKVVCCRYNIEKQRAEHYMATTEKDLVQSVGSKYIQSYTLSAFRCINRGEKYLITGTPCQIDSFRRMIRKYQVEDNFILLDFFCHAVPSVFAWEAYLRMVKRKIGKITYVSWRNKYHYGWHDSWIMGIDGGGAVNCDDMSFDELMAERSCLWQSRKSQGDVFYQLFLGDFCPNKACVHDCKYKYCHSSADIRIGDLWGKTYEDNQSGVSAVVAFTEKGCETIGKLKGITLISHPFETVAEGQMQSNVKPAILAPLMLPLLKYNSPAGLIEMVIFLQRVLNKIKSCVWKPKRR